MKTRQIVCWLLCAASPALAQVSPWSSGTYAYDGAGNVKAIGADYYVYDQVGRLVRGTADKERSGLESYQAYTYDAYGNRLTASTTGTQCVSGCGVNVQVNNANRVTDHNATYDAAGNLKRFDTNYYTYDGAGMVVTVSSSPTSADAQYIYTADDERLAIYTGGGNWRFTIRDLDAKVVREVTAFQSGGTTTWTWHRDHIFRDGLLLATVLPEGTQHYHLDHLGTPRLVTDGTGHKLGIHAYYPFGDELNLGLGEQLSPERLKYTGHERDDASNGTSLDYMHARSYDIRAGRLLSVDPALGNLLRPGSWNRYAYVLNSPMNYTDPTGMADNNSILTCSGPGGGIPCVHAEVTVVAKDPGPPPEKGNLFYRYLVWGHSIGDPIARYLNGGCGRTVQCGTVAFGELSNAPMSTLANVQDSELANLVDENYRPNPKYGDGGTADSIRHEMRTGELLSPSGHAQKGRQMITAIGNVMKAGRLSPSDREIAIQLASDLIKALMGN